MKRTLLIIDLQKGFGPTEELVRNISEHAKNYDTVVATQFMNGNKLFYELNQNFFGHSELTEEQLSLVALPANTKIFPKTGYGLPDEMIDYLKAEHIDAVDVCGLETDACVMAAMFNLWDAEIKPNLLRELTATVDTATQEASLLISKKNFGS
jgi:nicotinamidase-related amidase